jgi:hypothetical protein
MSMSHSSNGIPPEGTSPILTTNVDEFTLEEISHLAAFADVGARVAPPNPKGNKGSEDNPSLLLQDDAVQNNKGSEDDPSLLLQDDAVQNVDWVIEGVEELDADARRHMFAFYMNLKDWYCQRDYTSVLLTKAGYDEQVAFGMFLIEGGDCRSGFMAGTSTAYKWAKKYHVVTVGEESKVLVLLPEENHQKKRRKGVVHVESMRLEDLQQPTYAERLFADLWKICTS